MSSLETDVMINEDSVDFKTIGQIVFSGEDEVVRVDLDKNGYSVGSKLNPMFEVAGMIVEDNKLNSEQVDIARLTDIAEMENLYVSITPFPEEKKVQVVISDGGEDSPQEWRKAYTEQYLPSHKK